MNSEFAAKRHQFLYLFKSGLREQFISRCIACIDLCRGPLPDAALESIACEGMALAQPMRTIEELGAAAARAGLGQIVTLDLGDKVALSLEAMKAMVHNTKPLLRLQRSMGDGDSVYEAHVAAAEAVTRAFDSTAMALGYVGATAPGSARSLDPQVRA